MPLRPDAIAERPPSRVCHVCWFLDRIPEVDADVSRAWMAGDYLAADIIEQWKAEDYGLPLPKEQPVNRHRRGGCDGTRS